MKALTAVCALAFMACQAWQAGANRMEPLSKRHAHSEALRASPYTYCFAGPDGQLRTSSVLPSGTPWLSRAQFEDQIDENGWTFLRLEGRKSSNDTETAFAAGFLEGALTWQRISQFAFNTAVNATLGKPLEDWLARNADFVAAGVKANASTSPFWHQVGLMGAQTAGLEAGYASAAPPSASLLPVAFRNMQIGGDLEDLASAVSAQTGIPVEGLIPSAAMRARLGIKARGDGWGGGGHCSALVKLTADDLLIAQATWGSLNDLTRVFKRYDLPYRATAGGQEAVSRPTVFMSSYPGTLFSSDDYYVTAGADAQDPGMVVLETTIGNSNPTLWKFVQPQSVLEWVRNSVANRLGATGEQWCEVFSTLNSGTYNNEFIILDNSRVQLRKGSPPVLSAGALTMLDQLPGYVEYHDITDRLRTETYVPSYNVPAFPDVFERSGLIPIEKKLGPWFSYNATARALIFARNHTDVRGLDGMRAIMRYNNFLFDPISRQGQEGLWPPSSAENAIACRDDLNPANGTYAISALGHRNHVETDCKITSARLLRGEAVSTTDADGSGTLVGGTRYASVVISGPTHSGNMPPFRFSTSSFSPPPAHVGLPDLFAFDWVTAAL
ncbi:hypothetical protein FNF29_00611 [Cafeteria roenbergensis]|nr:hypothetical protein FNF29_00611 [Cafeteria roenbergensis]KAA0161920.1 hypothetical protein FNF31_03497 [Cafeteria roenbergensis]|eukprot:KAA0157259.1 hypothetical protein FNF29_00611 [Cafeteria roenbergensis]